jgi:hypothetical protein
VNVTWPRGLDPRARFQQAVLAVDALKSVPGVIAARGADISPLSNARPMRPLAPDLPETARWQVTEGHFATMGI